MQNSGVGISYRITVWAKGFGGEIWARGDSGPKWDIIRCDEFDILSRFVVDAESKQFLAAKTNNDHTS
jgi:hypothetical protein